MNIHEDSDVICIDWLRGLGIVVISKKDQFDFLLAENDGLCDVLRDDWSEANGSASVIRKDGIPHFIIIIVNPDPNLIAHECVHMAHYIMEEKGIPTDAGNTEVMAYLTGFLVEKLTAMCPTTDVESGKEQ